MFFTASKLFWLLAQPGTLLVIALAIAAALQWTRWQRLARLLVTTVAIGLALIAIVPIGEWLLVPLEQRIPRPDELPDQIDGIIVLGGAVDYRRTAVHGDLQLRESGERILTGVQLALLYPDAKLLFTGGVPGLLGSHASDQEAALGAMLTRFGIERPRVIFENRSRNTCENASFSRDAANPDAGDAWLLVTSAFHMPRSAGCFRSVGWPVVPYPVDYYSSLQGEWAPEQIDLGEGLRTFSLAVREWMGLLAYRLSGRIDSILAR